MSANSTVSINNVAWQDLSKDEQIPIYNLAFDHNYAVVGGPGTGKTILALYRVAQWVEVLKNSTEIRNGQDTLVLVYNVALRKYLQDALSMMQIRGIKVRTWHSWFWHFYIRKFGEQPPQETHYKNKWDEILPRFENEPDEPMIDHLIIDEFQDFPEALLQILSKYCIRTTIFGDPEQSVVGYSTTNTVTNIYNVGRRVHYLTKNYRNTKEISDVAYLFYTGSELPASTRKNGSKPIAWECASYEKSIALISNFADNNPAKAIGVLLPNRGKVNDNIVKYYRDIRKNVHVSVQRYLSDDRSPSDYGDENLDFGKAGVKVLSYATAKGLEFDAVFLPDINNTCFNDATDVLLKNALHVATSRAKERLFFMYTESNPKSFVMQTLNDNKALLEWRKF